MQSKAGGWDEIVRSNTISSAHRRMAPTDGPAVTGGADGGGGGGGGGDGRSFTELKSK